MILIGIADKKRRANWMGMIKGRMGLEAFSAADQDACTRYLDSVRLDLVILDEHLGELDEDASFLRFLRARFTMVDLPVLAVLHDADDDHELLALAAGANDCVVDVTDSRLVIQRMRNLIEMRQEAQQWHSSQALLPHIADGDDGLVSDVKTVAVDDDNELPTVLQQDSDEPPIPVEIPVNLVIQGKTYFCKSIWLTQASMLLLSFQDLPPTSECEVQMLHPDGTKLVLQVKESTRSEVASTSPGFLKLNLKILQSPDHFDDLLRIFRGGDQDVQADEPKSADYSERVQATLMCSSSSLSLNAIEGKRYRFEKLLGKGGFASVFLVRDMVLKRPVAMKVLNHAFARLSRTRASFLSEAQIAAQFHHANIVFVYEVGEIPARDYHKYLDFPAEILDAHPDRLIYFTMQLVEGPTLGQWIREHATKTEAECLDIIKGVARALEFAHQKGVVHRDIKPDNIMLAENGQVLVADFGIATPVAADTTDKGAHQLDIACTPHYASPEQLHGKLLDGRSDIYSLGILAYKLLTGALPFNGKTLSETVDLQINGKPPSLSGARPDLDPDFVALVNRCLAKEPQARYQNAGELLSDLRKLRGSARAGEADTSDVTLEHLVQAAIVAKTARDSAKVLEQLIAFLNLQKTYDDVRQVDMVKKRLSDPALLGVVIEKNLNTDNQQLLYEFFLTLESSKAVMRLLNAFRKEHNAWKKAVLAELAVVSAGRDLQPLAVFGLELGDAEACLLLKAFAEVAPHAKVAVYRSWAKHAGVKTQQELLRMLSMASLPAPDMEHILRGYAEGHGTAHPKVRQQAAAMLAS